MASHLKDYADDNTMILNPESVDQLVREAAHGNFQAVKDLITKNPNVNNFYLIEKENLFLFLNT